MHEARPTPDIGIAGTGGVGVANLPVRIVRAAASQGAAALAGKVLNLAGTIALARLLFPEDYGLFTIAMVVTGLANLFSHFGFQTYIIQQQEVSEEALNTCYTLNLAMSALLGLSVALTGVFWAAPPPQLPLMLALYGLHVFLSGLTYIQLALFKRDLDFELSSRVELEYSFTSIVGRIAFAAMQFGALSFPLGDVLASIWRWLRVRRLRRDKLRIVPLSSDATRAPVRFGMHTTSIGLASFAANQTDKLLASVTQPVAALGFYSFGSTTAAMFYNAMIVPQTSVFLAAFARLREDKEAARRLLATSSRLIFSLALPINMLWLLEAPRLTEAIFGAKWLPAVPFLRVFALGYLLRSAFGGIAGIQLAFGLAAQAARTKWINASTFIVFLGCAAAARVSLLGYALAYFAADAITLAHNAHVNGRLLEVQWGAYLRNLLPPAAAAAASTAAWALADFHLPPTPLWISAVVLTGTWLVAYLAVSAVWNRMVFATLARLLKSRNGP